MQKLFEKLRIEVLKSLNDQNAGYAESTKFFGEFRWKIRQILRLSDSKKGQIFNIESESVGGREQNLFVTQAYL